MKAWPRLRRRWSGAAVIMIAVPVVLSGVWPSTGSARDVERKSGGGSCVSPTGVDINERWGIPWRVITPFCTDALTGEHWSTSALWIMDTAFTSVPDGFVAEGDTPLEDFLAKFVGVKYVIDPGTNRERTYESDDVGSLAHRTIDGFPGVNSATMVALHPLPPGEHVVVTVWIFDAMHCDGFVANVLENCFPAGETVYHVSTFTVSRPAGG